MHLTEKNKETKPSKAWNRLKIGKPSTTSIGVHPLPVIFMPPPPKVVPEALCFRVVRPSVRPYVRPVFVLAIT